MKLQDYQVALSFGYLYLIVLGIFKEALFYSQLGVNILKYSSITDILISPISEITSSVFRISVFVTLVFLTFTLPSWLVKRKGREWVMKVMKLKSEIQEKDIPKTLLNFFFTMLGFGLFGFYIGVGIGGGVKISKKIKEDKLEFEDKLTYVNEKIEKVYLVGQNSSFLFYISEGEKEIKIAPIHNGTLKNIIERK